MADPLLILGASARAAAASAVRAGFAPLAADLFGDHDLRRLAGVTRQVDCYPGGLVDCARDFPQAAWIYAGGLENHPQVIGAIAAERPLWGNGPEVIRRIRDPWHLAAALRREGLRFPDVRPFTDATDPGLVLDGVGEVTGWIRKPRRSAGGGSISWWPPRRDAADGQHKQRPEGAAAWYLQRFVEGESQSAVYVAANGQAVLLGVTKQLIGARWAGASGFRYCGSIGPLQPGPSRLADWSRIGGCLARQFHLQGLFGVDAVVNDQGPWVVEVNPRYTSSVEILEFGNSVDALGEHAAACRDGRLYSRLPGIAHRFRGKAILYAGRDIQIGASFVEAACRANEGGPWPMIADVPVAHQRIAAGRPVATLFAEGDNPKDTEVRLMAAVADWQATWGI